VEKMMGLGKKHTIYPTNEDKITSSLTGKKG
jgi:hypothetical protein